jgi:subfamily B ATP-binding cassette protein MsbA
MHSLLERLKRIAPFFSASRWGFVLAIAGSMVGAATEPLIPQLLKVLLDKGFQSRMLPLWAVPVAIVGLFAIRGLAGFVAQYGLAWSANRGVENMRVTMFERLVSAEPSLFSRHTASSLTNTLVYEVQGGASQLVYSLMSLVRDSLSVVALFFYLLWLNWQLTLIVAVLFPSVALIMRVLSRRLHRLTVAGQQATDELAYVVEENVLAWRIVRLHGAAPSEAARFSQLSQRLRRLSLKSVIASSTMTPLTQILAASALSVVILLAMTQSGGASAGDFVAFIAAMGLIITPTKHLSEVFGPVTRGLASLERGVALLEDSAPESGGGYDPGRATGHIELRGVTLRYRDDQAALDGVSLTLRAGETVALVGPSGAGKSTLINLLPRFLEPTNGELRLDDRALADWDIAALRRQFALVSQDVVLFNDSVAENVCLGSTPDRERVREALRSANLLEFVDSLPHSIDSLIGHNGSELSGGQRQRLAIARAVYKDAPILILDEATSALDSESERQVQAALDTLMRGRTTLVIAHRLSTIERADRIVALEAGRIVEQGTHAELLARGGLYARLHALQFRS